MMIRRLVAPALAIAFLQTVDSAAYFNPYVSCTAIAATTADRFFQVCATFDGTSPSPATYENATGIYTFYVGGWTHDFTIYDASAEGLAPLLMDDFPDDADLDMTVAVDRDDDNTCTVHVKMPGEADFVACKSCLYCAEGTMLDDVSASYSADCTNLEKGRMVECEPASTDAVFFPLTEAALVVQPAAAATAVTATGTCKFVRNDEIMTWFDHNDIAIHRMGCNLASITSLEEQLQVEDLYAEDSIGKHIWIGAVKNEETGEWEWTDGSAFNYTNWSGPGEPSSEAYETRAHLMYPNYPQSNMKWNNRAPTDMRMALYKCCG